MPDPNKQSEAHEGIIESVADVNTKAVGEHHATANNILAQEAVAHHAAMNRIREMTLTRAADVILSSPAADLADNISQLLAVINTNQQSVKSAQTTPPVTP